MVDTANPSKPHRADAALWVVILAVAVGAALRIAEVAQDHTFGFDDTALAINIATRSAAQLAKPLLFEQTAPVLFLWIDRLLVDLFGVSEVALRLLPLVAGIAVLPLTWIAGRRLVSAPATALAVALLAVSPLAVDYSDSVKPYIVDAAVALTLIGLTIEVLRTPEGHGAHLALLVAGMVALFVSTPAVFTLAACVAALLMLPATRRRAGVLMLAWAAVAAYNYLAFQRATAHNPALQRYWDEIFFTPGAPNLVERVRVVASSYVQNLYFGISLRPLIALRIAVAILVALGVTRVWRQMGAWAATLLAGPLALAVIAATVRVYPPSDRTWLFTGPSMVLLAAAGVAALSELLPAGARARTFVALSVAALLLPAHQSWVTLRALLRPDSLDTAIRDWRAIAKPRDPIYIFSRDAIRWTYYTTEWAKPDTVRLNWLMAAAQSIGPNSGNAPTRGRAVHDEGENLVYSGTGRAELIGIATGMEDGIPHAQPHPDTGWAENEAERVDRAARDGNGDAWLFFLYCDPPIDSLVLRATERRGAHLVSANQFDRTRVYLVRF
jgi:4-amino-4-deoxy-L-arabinose transferase-like glycosyltransferase